MRPIRFAIALLILSSGAAHAAWEPNGNAISTAATSSSHPTLASDGAGGFYVAWVEAGSGQTNVYLQRVLGDGSIAHGWHANGLPITTNGLADSPIVLAGENGRAMLVWQNAGVRVRWFSPEGSPDLPPDNPMVVTNGTALVAAATDGAGGAYIGWSKSSGPSSTTAYVTHLDALGNFVPPFTAGGTALATNTYINSIDLAPDPAGGVAFAVNSTYDGPFVHFLVRVGNVSAGGGVAGTVVGPADRDYGGIAIADGQGGVFAHWTTERNFGGPTGPLLQRIGAAGQQSWPNSLGSPGYYAALERDGMGGVYELAVADGSGRVEARRRLADGTLAPGWPVTISQSPLVDNVLGAVPVTAGFIACWADGATDLDVRAIGLQLNGGLAPGWPAGGLPVTTFAGDQRNVVVLPTPTEGVFAAWLDTYPGSAGVDLYATRVEVHPPVGVAPGIAPGALAFRSIAPNPARSSVHVELALADEVPATIELIDVRGRVVLQGAASASTTLATDAMPAGLYWLRATQGVSRASRRLVIIR